MKILLMCDTAADYGFDNESDYIDFSFAEEIAYVKNSLEELGHTVIEVHSLKKLIDNCFFYNKNFDVVFNMFEGYHSRNRESFVPCICELLNIPYTGSDAFAMSLTLNKHHLLQYVADLNIAVPQGIRIINANSIVQSLENWSLYPCVVKPEHEGSSMGVSFIKDCNQLISCVEEQFKKYEQAVLVQEYIEGAEISVCLLENHGEPYVYTLKQFTTVDGFNIPLFDRDSKRFNNHESIVPNINIETIHLLEEQSKLLFRNIPLRDVARIDWRLNNCGEPYLLEITPIPDWRRGTEFEMGDKTVKDALMRILNNAKWRYNL